VAIEAARVAIASVDSVRSLSQFHQEATRVVVPPFCDIDTLRDEQSER
jgi:hypothetical protein